MRYRPSLFALLAGFLFYFPSQAISLDREPAQLLKENQTGLKNQRASEKQLILNWQINMEDMVRLPTGIRIVYSN